MNIPTLQFISEVERVFSVCYPKSFKKFCNGYHDKNILAIYPNITKGQFITDIETLKNINLLGNKIKSLTFHPNNLPNLKSLLVEKPLLDYDSIDFLYKFEALGGEIYKVEVQEKRD